MRVISDTYRTSVFLIDRCHSLSHLIVPEGFPLTPSSCRREKKEKEKQVKKLTKTCGTVVSVCEQNRKTAFTLVNIWHVIQFKYLQKFVFCLILQFIKESTCTRENRMCSISSSNTMDFVVLCVPQRTVKYPANYFSFIFYLCWVCSQQYDSRNSHVSPRLWAMLWSLFTATFSVRLVRFGVEQQLRAVTHSDSRRSQRKTSKKKVKTSKPTESSWSKTRTFFQLSQAEQTPGGGETGGTNGTQVRLMGHRWRGGSDHRRHEAEQSSK